MAATIRTYLNGDLSTVVEGASRNDLRPGDVVTVESIGALMTAEGHRWTLAFTPDDLDGNPSAAALADELAQTTTFQVDNEGAYLLRLVTDPYTEHESVQFVRLRVLTAFGSLKLVAAGERRDGTGIIPVDVSTEGWANDQNYNLQELLKHISRTAVSSRVVYVDPNRGHDYSNSQNTEDAEGYGDFWKIQDAIDHAVAGGDSGVPASPDHPWVIVIRPGRYVESLNVPEGIHLVGEPASTGPVADIETIGNPHFFNIASTSAIMGLRFHSNVNVSNGMLQVKGGGTLHIKDCTLEQLATGPAAGPCISVSESTVVAHDSRIYSANISSADRFAIRVEDLGQVQLVDCAVRGESGVHGLPGSVFSARHTTITSSSANAGSHAIRSQGSVSVSGGGVSCDDPSLTAIHVRGNAAALKLELVNTFVSGKLHFNRDTAIAYEASLSSVAIKPEDIEFLPSEADCNVVHGTAGESVAYWADKETHSSSFMVGAIPADSVQEALDRILNLSLGIASLSDAYNGIIDHTKEPFVRGDGAGNRIVADAIDGDGKGIPVQITDKESPDAAAGIGNSKGRLQVVSNVEVGAIDAPEIDLDPNPYGVGPVLTLGNTVFPGGGHFPVGAVVGNADPDSGFIYNVRLQTQASHNNSGAVVIEAGDSLPSNAPAGDGGSVHLAAGRGVNGGDITLWPSDGIASNGRVVFKSGSLASAAGLTAKNPFVGGVEGTLVLGTSFTPAIIVEVLAGDDLGAVIAKIDAASHNALIASDLGGALHLEAQHDGPLTDVFLVSTSDANLNVALGDLTAGNATFATTNTAQNHFSFQVPIDNEISMGVDGAAGPMVYNADTGNLDVPGAIGAGSLETTGDLVVGGDLTVMGDSTIAYTSTVQVEDKNLELGTIEGGGETDVTADGGGITVKGDTDKTLAWDMASSAWAFNQNVSTTGSLGTLTLDSEGLLKGNMGLWADGSHLIVGSKTNNDFFVFLNDAETLQITRGASWTKYVSHGGTGSHWLDGQVTMGTNTPTPGKVLTVDGDVKITGVLDPTALVITHEPAVPTAVAEGETAIWVDDTGAVKLLQHIEGEGTTVVDELAKSSSTGSSTLSHRQVSEDIDVAPEDYFIGCDSSAGLITVWLDPSIPAGRDLIIKNQTDALGHGVLIEVGSMATGGASGSFDADTQVLLDPWEGVRIISNGGGSWSLV